MLVWRLVSVVKMMTMLEVCTTEEQRSVVRFLWAKGFNAKDIHKKKLFSVYGGKCLSHKAIHIWVEKFSQGCSKVADDAESAETTVRNFYAAGFDTLIKKWDKCINGGGCVEK
jgi:hypothetical protein